jgi:DNA-binding NarL/FixJ family response regulator
MKTEIRILICDDHPVVREGLVTILTRQRDIKVIGEAKDGEEACRLYDTLLPDILLLDLRMPKKDGLEVITELMSRMPSPLIIVMTTYEATEDIRLALTAGAKGYMLKDAESTQVWDTVRRVFAGELVLPPDVTTKLVDSLAQPELSERELQILKQLCSGKSNKEIAQKLYISESTVKHHAKSVFKKLGAVCRSEAIAKGVKRGLIRIV